MKKKPTRPRKKKPAAPRTIPIEHLQTAMRVKEQLASMKEPVVDPAAWRQQKLNYDPSWNPTVMDYRKMDPFYLSTMGGAFAGRVLKKRKILVSAVDVFLEYVDFINRRQK